ncbi:hypothetical protein VB711_02940 [Cronbergia sp. UHCC 0137]|uniref:hypothetical protein n=1 Tax=Cronbergia sp. UHCC 0137 TaxID=3110239 RepID=UPI002B1F778F|nr:hypothetical protein [Cronbergia sp. UHCC 0137]MEA5616798.1 hypothetical protein [Cronbergia sp. UHCC 0137]
MSIVQLLLDYLHRVKATRKDHPLAKFAGILSNAEATEIKMSGEIAVLSSLLWRKIKLFLFNNDKFKSFKLKAPFL